MILFSLGNQYNRSYLLIKNIFKSTVFSVSTEAVPCFKRLVAETLPRKPGFNSRPNHVGFVLDKGVGGADYSLTTRFFSANIISSTFDTPLRRLMSYIYIYMEHPGERPCRSPAEIVGSNPTGGMDICLL